MSQKLIEEGTFVLVKESAQEGRFLRWYEDPEYGLNCVILLGDGSIDILDPREIKVQVQSITNEQTDYCLYGHSIGIDFLDTDDCKECDKSYACKAYNMLLLRREKE